MTIQLEQIRLLEETANNYLYLCNSSEVILPGEQLISTDLVFAVIRCRKLTDEIQLLIQSPALLDINSEYACRKSGTAITFKPSKPVFVFAEGPGINTALHWLDELRQSLGDKQSKTLINGVVFHEQHDFNFRPAPSTFMLSGMPSYMIASVPLLEDLGIASKLCCDEFKPGCFEGNLAELCQSPDWSITAVPWVGFVSKETANTLIEQVGEPEYIYKI